MKKHLSLALALSLSAAAPLAYAGGDKCDACPIVQLASLAATAKPGKLVPVTEKEAAWAEKQRAEYPLKTCVVSGEALGSMGKSPEYIYRVEGQPDRLVIFCCDGCEEDFNANPPAALGKIDEAKKKAGAEKKA